MVLSGGNVGVGVEERFRDPGVRLVRGVSGRRDQPPIGMTFARTERQCFGGQRAHTQDAVSTWAAKLFMLRRRQGRLAELTPIVERLAHGGARGTGWLSALGLIHAETGDEEAARAIYEGEMCGGTDALPRGMFWLTTVALLSEVCAKLHDAERARALYAALISHAHRNVVVAYSSFWGPVQGYLALLAATWGDRALATRHVRSALLATRAMDAPLLTAELEERHNRLLTA